MNEKLALVVLAGGKSLRMGQDKATMKLSCLPQAYLTKHDYLIFSKKEKQVFFQLDFLWQSLWTFSKLIKKYDFIDTTIYISCRKEQKEFFTEHILQYPDIASCEFILDNGNGVCDAFITSFETLNKPILCLPCDAPYVQVEDLEQLIFAWQKNPQYYQYTFVDPNNDRRETLISLYTQNAKNAFINSMHNKIRIQNSIDLAYIYQIPFTEKLRKNLHNINKKEDLFLEINTIY